MPPFEEVVNADFEWSKEKNEILKRTRGISFEEVERHIRQDDLLAIEDYPNQVRYPGQVIFIVNINAYAHKVPAVPMETGYFLKTAYPNSKANRDYLL